MGLRCLFDSKDCGSRNNSLRLPVRSRPHDRSVRPGDGRGPSYPPLNSPLHITAEDLLSGIVETFGVPNCTSVLHHRGGLVGRPPVRPNLVSSLSRPRGTSSGVGVGRSALLPPNGRPAQTPTHSRVRRHLPLCIKDWAPGA